MKGKAHTSFWSGLGLFCEFIGPGDPPGGTGMILTSGTGGGNGLSDGGHRPNVRVPRKGTVIFRHSGLGAGSGRNVLVGEDPDALVTTVVESRIFFVVNGGKIIVVDEPLTVVIIGPTVQVVVVIIGGNTNVHGYEQVAVGLSQNVAARYIVWLY